MQKLTFKQKLALLTDEQLLLVEAYIDELHKEVDLLNGKNPEESD
jgi:hypothetical protein